MDRGGLLRGDDRGRRRRKGLEALRVLTVVFGVFFFKCIYNVYRGGRFRGLRCVLGGLVMFVFECCVCFFLNVCFFF